MRRWHLLPIALVALVVVALPVAALTETGLEHEFREVVGLNTGDCEPTTNLASPWTTGPSLPFKLDEPRAATIGDQVYIAGGVTGLEHGYKGRILLEPSDRVMRFDPHTGSYTELAPLPRRLNHIGVVGYGGHLYVLGGYGRTLDTHTSKAFYRYDPVADHWSRMPDMPEPRAAMAVGVIGDQLIVAGGTRDNIARPEAFSYDFGTRRWSRLPDMPDRREHVGSAVLGGKLYVLGGRAPESLALDTADSYDARRRRWTSLPPMPVSSGGLEAVRVGGEVVAVGGGNDGAETVTGAVQAWDPRSGRWNLLPGMRTARHGHAAVFVGGRIWVFGGSPCAYFNATDSVEQLRVPAASATPAT